MAGGWQTCENSQDTEGDVDVAVVVLIAVDRRQSTIIAVTHDESVVNVVRFSFRVQICRCPSVSPDEGFGTRILGAALAAHWSTESTLCLAAVRLRQRQAVLKNPTLGETRDSLP